jgi:hypothetical protein
MRSLTHDFRAFNKLNGLKSTAVATNLMLDRAEPNKSLFGGIDGRSRNG